jgi:membrane-anchored glycerophosphoryl diester phosphodiesterase (GDPDase)
MPEGMQGCRSGNLEHIFLKLLLIIAQSQIIISVILAGPVVDAGGGAVIFYVRTFVTGWLRNFFKRRFAQTIREV